LILSDRFTPATTLARLSDATLGVTHYFCVPQMAAAMRQDPAYMTTSLSRLKAIFTGGAPLPRPLVEAYLADGVTLVNGYGMSEAGTVIHMPLDAQTSRRHAGCIGFPAPTMSTRIVDRDGRDVASGQDGELWIKGPAVTPGYWNQPEATARAFTDGWFHTGDVARQEDGGLYRLLDRSKDMYISGGENVYPAEVEAVLLAHSDVLEAAVIGAPHPRWEECGVAFLVARPGSALGPAEVLACCEERLARFKHPAYVNFVDQLPRTASGKVQKDVLRKLHAETHAQRFEADLSKPLEKNQ
jgi:fatty-acyl-CoA synthase